LIASFLAMTFATAPALAPVTPTLAAPQIVDPALIPGTGFTADFTISNVEAMLGYQIWLSWDPTIIKATAASTEYPFTYGWGDSPKIEDGYLYMVFTFPLPELTGFYGDLTIVHVTFEVVDYGVSELQLYNTIIMHISDPPISHIVNSGVFSNIWPLGTVPSDVYVGLTTGFIESRNFKVSKEPDAIQTLTAQIESGGIVTTKVVVKFRVLDSMGGPVAEMSTQVYIEPGQTLRVAADLDTTTLGLPASYIVEYQIEYVGFFGLTLGRHGGANAAKSAFVATFKLDY